MHHIKTITADGNKNFKRIGTAGTIQYATQRNCLKVLLKISKQQLLAGSKCCSVAIVTQQSTTGTEKGNVRIAQQQKFHVSMLTINYEQHKQHPFCHQCQLQSGGSDPELLQYLFSVQYLLNHYINMKYSLQVVLVNECNLKQASRPIIKCHKNSVLSLYKQYLYGWSSKKGKVLQRLGYSKTDTLQYV